MSDGIFSILYPKDESTVPPAPFLVYGLSVYSNRDLVALLRGTDDDPTQVWMGQAPEREPPDLVWYFSFDNVPPDTQCDLEIWCTKTRELLGRVAGVQTQQPATKAKGGGFFISYPIAPGDNPAPNTFVASGSTDDFTHPLIYTMTKNGASVIGSPGGMPSISHPSWTATFVMGTNCGDGWTLNVRQGINHITSPNLSVTC
jgi:hypothetical protein